MAFEAGQRIGDYQIVRALGAGGLGAVYQVQHLISGRAEAMKVLLPDKLDTPEVAERFRREIQVLATLNHVNIAALHNAFYYGDQLIMVMELIDGETLAARTARGPVPLPKAISYVSQVLSALAVAHASGIVHRDIKPSNIMIAKQDIVKLLDFGIAVSQRAPHLTQAGYIVGSIHYMSPEQVSSGVVTPRSDIYSVGVTLYELVTGKLPITGATTWEVMTGHVQRIPVEPIELNAHLPLTLSNAVAKALSKDPDQRFPSAETFRDAIRLGEGATVVADPSPTPRSFPAPASKPVTDSAAIPAAIPIDEVTRQLAVHIGPVAKFIVRKLAASCTDADQLYTEAAKQIPSDEARQKFLRSRRR